MVRLAAVLRPRGFDLVRSTSSTGKMASGRPDTMPRLKRCLSAVVSRARKELGPRRLIIGGRSMGGRAASMLAADGMACDALLLLAYPLHPAGKPEQLRDAHLPQIKVPVLCSTARATPVPPRPDGERSRHRARAVGDGTGWEGADHSFHVLKSSGRTDADVLDEVGDCKPALALPADEAAGPVLRWNVEQRRPGSATGVPAPTNVVKLAYRVREARWRDAAGDLLRSGRRHRQFLRPPDRRRLRRRGGSQHLRRLPLSHRQLRAGRRDLPVRLQPRRVHGAQHRRHDPQVRDPRGAPTSSTTTPPSSCTATGSTRTSPGRRSSGRTIPSPAPRPFPSG